MRSASRRLVLGFFPPGTGHPESVLRGFSPADRRIKSRYGPLLLPEERLAGARVARENVQEAARRLRDAGSPSVFVLYEAEPPQPAGELRGDARQQLLTRLDRGERNFHDACAGLEDALRLHHTLAAAAEWLLDNSYLVVTNAAEIRRNLPKHHSAAEARLYDIARALVERTDGAITPENLAECLREDHEPSGLTMADLWLFPLVLRVALIERLSDIARETGWSQQLHETASLWADRLAAAARAGTVDAMLTHLDAEPAAPFPHFGIELLEQLQDEESALAPAQRWMERRFGGSLAPLVQQEHTHEAARRVSTVNAFGSLRILGRLEFAEIFEQVSRVEADLRKDPGGIYPRSDFDTRDQCRHVVEQIARHSPSSEPEVARAAVRLAWRSGGHVAQFLLSSSIAELEKETATRVPVRTKLVRAVRRHATLLYFSLIFALTACFAVVVIALAHEAGARNIAALAIYGILALFPLSELAMQIVNALVISMLPPAKLPKMSFRDGIPEDQATLVVVPMMLTNPDAVRHELEKLEIRLLANPESNLWFGLLADFTDCAHASDPADEALLEAVRQGIVDLNRRYPGERFVLFHRQRVWSQSEQRWIGRERKRGKLEELNAFLCGEGDPNLLVAGRLPVPVRYVLTLDSDTQLPPETARRLIETMAHPLNRVELDPVTRVRRSGYTVIQPRVSIALPDANATRFTRVFADASGTDPYCKAVSDAHQDLFSEAIFHGKAIYEVQSMHTVLKDRFPPETLLSHDLIEGAHAGVGHASDIELFETIPRGYGTFSKREHRWIRGDWQIAPWIFPRVPAPAGRVPNPLSALNRWRILDNLRRSLVPGASFLLLVLGWLFGPAPGVWSLAVGLAIAIPATAPLLERWARTLQRVVESWQGAADQLIRAMVVIAFLPHQAWLAADAIIRANYRRKISCRNLLEWEPADSAHAHHHRNTTLRRMLLLAALSVVLMVALAEQDRLWLALPFLILWAISPALMLWLSRPAARFGHALTAAGDTDFLRVHARRTWRYFDDLVNDESHWLPPDNSQLSLRVEIAPRTSPTNIGMWLASALVARDLGYLTPDDLLERCSKTMATLDRLERYEGHLLNWYDTRTLDPLNPRYVSTVDSGNLLASLWVLEQGCRDAVNHPVIGQACLHGLSDTLAILEQVCGDDAAVSASLAELRRLFHAASSAHEIYDRLHRASAPLAQVLQIVPSGGEPFYWASRLQRELNSWIATADRYLPTPVCEHAPALSELTDNAAAVETVSRFEQLAADARRLAGEINMRFLYDPARRLFGVGYAVGNPLEFTSHYDLLASECRLASLAAIAKGDVPRDHWNALGRPRAASRGPIVLSWTGTMFEYLMPMLYTRSFRGSLLDRACHDAVKIQMEHGRLENLPWGVSECAYSAIDANQIYQYRAFGDPALALKRGMEESAVVAPYATMLALQVDAAAAIDNLKRLEKLGLAGPMGFYESIDFSRESKQGQRGVAIYAYMAHHQGMSLIAMNNVLHRGAMQRRFHSQLRVRAFESLLFERIPIHRARLEEIVTQHVPIRHAVEEEPAERIWKNITAVSRVHLNGNGRYLLWLSNSGTGFSRWSGFDVTRWRSDPVLELYGSFLYIRDVQSSAVWSATNRPIGGDWGTSSAIFSPDRARFLRRVSGLETRTDVTVAPEDDVEVRRVLAMNRSVRKREIEFTSYVELSLAPHRADTAHPAFAKMFVETSSPSEGVLIAHRRPRSPEDPQIWAAHVLLGARGPVSFETDRAQFLGRGNTPANPAALNGELSGEIGAVLDPIFSLRCRVTLAPRERAELTFVTMVASTREALLALIEKYSRPGEIARSFEMAWTRSQLDLRYLGLRAGSVHRFQQLAGFLLYPNPALRAAPQRLARNRLGQSALWAYGISGDLPMLAVTIADSSDLSQVRELLLAHTYCRLLGFQFDLIVLNQEGASYDRPLREELTRYIAAHAECVDCPGGVFLRDWNEMPEAHRDLILASSSVALHAGRGSLDRQIAASAAISPAPRFIPARDSEEEPATRLAAVKLSLSNGIGGFTSDEYVISLKNGAQTPAPWSNVIANERFGTLVTERGLGFTWNENSQTNRLTPWHNDPVSDPQSEMIYVRDDETGAILSRDSGEARVRHGQGYSIYEHVRGGIAQKLTVFVPEHDPVKVCRMELRNESSRPRALSVVYFAELVLGSVREDQQLHIQTAIDPASGALTAVQYWSDIATGQVAFAAADPRAESWSGDRASFLGRFGSRTNPAALGAASLDGRVGAGLDPCAALQVRVNLAAGERRQVTFLLGQAAAIEEARGIIGRNLAAEPGKHWQALLGTLQVRTPLPSADLLLNRWLLYQALSCRFWGRSALYQSSGAFGFRDQLQDCLAFVYARPSLTREHILTCAARQFREGDVQHWWHPATGLGVRTRCSDDLVWLPYAITRYVEITGDASILDEPVAFLEGPPLADSEHERMFVPKNSSEMAPLREHARRALERAWRLGAHGVPLIGTGDWNDGLNRVGMEGRGESVWLAWFLIATLEAFARIDASGPWLERVAQLARAVELTCWDGDWYLRGFFDDGSPLGSHQNAEARMDSLPQSWAVISGAANPERARIAMDAADRFLVDEKNRIVKLFTPPFDHSEPHPGYIMAYPPGVRENGGQYTHGSLWLALARARMGDGDRAVELLQMMNPIEHGRDAARYVGEPYVAAADVYASPNKEGRAGWTWYTGSAAWMYRIWIEEVLGFKLRGNILTIEPAVPGDWPGFEITYRYGSSTYEIRAERHEGFAAAIELVDDGRVHRILVPIAPRQEKLEPAETAGVAHAQPE